MAGEHNHADLKADIDLQRREALTNRDSIRKLNIETQAELAQQARRLDMLTERLDRFSAHTGIVTNASPDAVYTRGFSQAAAYAAAEVAYRTRHFDELKNQLRVASYKLVEQNEDLKAALHTLRKDLVGQYRILGARKGRGWSPSSRLGSEPRDDQKRINAMVLLIDKTLQSVSK